MRYVITVEYLTCMVSLCPCVQCSSARPAHCVKTGPSLTMHTVCLLIHFCREMLCISVAYTVARCLSVMFVYSVETNEVQIFFTFG